MSNRHKPIGNQWLLEKYGLIQYHITHRSYVGTRPKKEVEETGNIIEIYPPNYQVREATLDHIEFGLKYDDWNLDFLTSVFKRISQEEMVAYIGTRPRGINQRKIGFLYEFLINQKLSLEDVGKTNYVDLLDSDRYITGGTIKNSRWAINDNLLGERAYCPIIRKTKALEKALEPDFQKLVEVLAAQFPPDVFHRAVNYLYTKETKSSYQIEKEEPSPDRMDRFIRILERAGKEKVQALLSEKNLTGLQNEIVDPRFADAGFRKVQNYIGQSSISFKQIYHYICPPPEFVISLMEGLTVMALRMKDQHPIAQASAVAFGFVFIHPFEDGNGRIHRFLIHDFLTRNKLVQAGMIIPVSANMLNHIKAYDEVLEKYSRPLFQRITYEEQADQSIRVTNPADVEGYFRYPDLTEQTIYLGHTIEATITEDIFREMDFLVRYDEVKTAIQQIADIPDKHIDLFIKFMHQNNGQFPKRRRKDFEKLTEDEIQKMELAFKEIFDSRIRPL
jgi:hypothetical protein